MTTPQRPAPTSYDRSLCLTTMHWRAPSFGTLATPDACAIQRARDAEGEDAAAELAELSDESSQATGRSVLRSANALADREAAWTADPRCAVCEKMTSAPERCALLETPDGHRITCKGSCFAIGVARINPTFSTSVALRRAEA